MSSKCLSLRYLGCVISEALASSAFCLFPSNCLCVQQPPHHGGNDLKSGFLIPEVPNTSLIRPIGYFSTKWSTVLLLLVCSARIVLCTQICISHFYHASTCTCKESLFSTLDSQPLPACVESFLCKV